MGEHPNVDNNFQSFLRATQPRGETGKLDKLIVEFGLIYGGAFLLAQLNRLVPQFTKRQHVFAFIPGIMVSSSVVLGVDRCAKYLIKPRPLEPGSTAASKSESIPPEESDKSSHESAPSQSSSSSSSSSTRQSSQSDPKLPETPSVPQKGLKNLFESGAVEVGNDSLLAKAPIKVEDAVERGHLTSNREDKPESLSSTTQSDVSRIEEEYVSAPTQSDVSRIEEEYVSAPTQSDVSRIEEEYVSAPTQSDVSRIEEEYVSAPTQVSRRDSEYVPPRVGKQEKYVTAKGPSGGSRKQQPPTTSSDQASGTAKHFGVRTGADQGGGKEYVDALGPKNRRAMLKGRKITPVRSTLPQGYVQVAIPSEMLVHIFSFLTERERTRAGMTCRLWHNCAFDPRIAGLNQEDMQRLFHTTLHPRKSFLQNKTEWKLSLEGFDPGFPTCRNVHRFSTPGLRPLGEGCFPPTIELNRVTHILLPTLRDDESGYDYQLINGATGKVIGRFKGHGGMPIAYDAKRHNGIWYLAGSSTTPSVKFFVFNEMTGEAQQIQGVMFNKTRPLITVLRLASIPTRLGNQLVGLMADESGNLATWVVGQESKDGASALALHTARISAMVVLGDLVVSGDVDGNIVVCRVGADGSLVRIDGKRFRQDRADYVTHGGVASFGATGANTFVAGFEHGQLVGFEVDPSSGKIRCNGDRSNRDSSRPVRRIMAHPLNSDESLLISVEGMPLQTSGDTYVRARGPQGGRLPPEARYSLNYHLLSRAEDGEGRITQWGSDTMNERVDATADVEYVVWAQVIYVQGVPTHVAMLGSPGGTEWNLVAKPLEEAPES